MPRGAGARTTADVGSAGTILAAADVCRVCPALVSRPVMAADPVNIAHCPNGIFGAARDSAASLGDPIHPDGPMDAVADLAAGLARKALGA